MSAHLLQPVHADVAGQDDNLGDSALRRAYLDALAGPRRRFHLVGRVQTSDYLEGLSLTAAHEWYEDRGRWLASQEDSRRPVHVFNAGEIDLAAQREYPTPRRSKELAEIRRRGGVIIAAGIGVKDVRAARSVEFSDAFRRADVLSWRDFGSRAAVGFGEVNPDWAFALGTVTAAWTPARQRDLIVVTMRFDRPYPDQKWIAAVRRLAEATSTRIVTTAQVARDAPRAVQLAADIGGEYLGAPSFSHGVLDEHVRALYQRSLAVISDRAHGLIIGATEGAYPVGSGADPQKIIRLLDTVNLGSLVGHYDELGDYADLLPGQLDNLAPSIDSARDRLARLSARVQAVVGSVAPL